MANRILIVHSLIALINLALDDPVGATLFNQRNIAEMWRLVFSMATDGSWSTNTDVDTADEHSVVMQLVDLMLGKLILRNAVLADGCGAVHEEVDKLMAAIQNEKISFEDIKDAEFHAAAEYLERHMSAESTSEFQIERMVALMWILVIIWQMKGLPIPDVTKSPNFGKCLAYGLRVSESETTISAAMMITVAWAPQESFAPQIIAAMDYVQKKNLLFDSLSDFPLKLKADTLIKAEDDTTYIRTCTQINDTIHGLQDLERRLNEAREQMKKEFEVRESIMERKLVVWETKVDVQHLEILRLQDLVDMQKMSAQQHRSVTSTQAREIAQLQSALQEATSQRKRMNEKLTSIQGEASEWREKYIQEQQAAEQGRASAEELAQELENIAHQLETEQQRVIRLEEEKRQIEQVENQRRKDLEQSSAELMENAAMLKEQREKLQKKSDQQNAKIKELEEQMASMMEEERDREEIYQRLEKGLSTLKTKRRARGKENVAERNQQEAAASDDVGTLGRKFKNTSIHA
ncbi:hypothetical protein HK097_005555 [Rhizophlyctis rosea]|uniref:Uncharacterized protein n=1 Tax=Rhizophlyctis rosea TaxID=64517 RepID=A0AAD5SJ78_9FUNG|nr:hypothetical protein HK097_005555 [Rhizophlyctis rosea]